MTQVWALIKAIPQILSFLQGLFQFIKNVQKHFDEQKNKKIKEELENVKTPEDAQSAADSVADRFGDR